MPGLSKVIVLDPDARAGRQVALGFQREGVSAEVAEVPRDPADLALPAEAALVVVGGTDLQLVRQARRCLEEAKVDAPIVFAGRGVRRTDAEAAGADEVVLQPAYLRDVVTIGRLLHGQPAAQRAHLVGSLVETTGVLTLVRALAALGRSAVLTLIRGLRRGEVRFYHGEVTSAQVGLIHGQAALHQLLLWTDARFDFLHEDVVRRHQIPLERDELFADADRFLSGVRESAGRLSPAMVLEQDVPRIKSLGKQIPPEVNSVLRMFDGHRVLADVLEDSPYRVFETLRVAQLAMEGGLVREATGPRPRATWRAVLAIEEWLVGAETRDDVLERQAGDSGPVPRQAADGPSGPVKAGGGGKGKGSRRKRKKRRAQTPIGVAAAPAPKQDIDWGSLVPRTSAAEVGPLAGVVPASEAAGEITLPPRERLEELTDPSQRDRIFPADEASVVYDEAAERERQRISAERKAQVEKAQEKVAREAEEMARRLAEARATLVTPPEEMVAAIRGDGAAPRAVEPKQTERMPTVAPAPGEPRPERPAPTASAVAGGPRAESAAPEAAVEIKRTLPMPTVAVPPDEAEAAAVVTAAATTEEEEAKPTEQMAALTEVPEIKRTLPMPMVVVPPGEVVAEPAGDATPSAAPVATAAMPTRKMRAAVPFESLEAAALAEAKDSASEAATVTAEAAEAAPASAEAAPTTEAAPATAEAAPATAEAAPATAEAAPATAEAAPTTEAAPTPTAAETAPAPVEQTPASAVSAPAPAPVDPALAPTEPVVASPSIAPASEATPLAPSTAAPTVRIITTRPEPATIESPAEPAADEPALTTEPAPTAEPAADETLRPSAPVLPQNPVPTAPAVLTTMAPTRPMRVVTPAGMPPLARPEPTADDAPDPTPPAAAEAHAAPTREAQASVSGELGSPAAAAPVAPADDADTVRGKRPSDGLPAITIEVGIPKELPPVIVELDRGATPVATVDEPSDGVIRQTIASAETAPTGRRGSPPPGSIPIDDRPEDTTGEIVTRTGRRAAVAPPPDAEPSILVADLAEAHTAVAAVATEQAAAPALPTMATPVTERVVTEVSKDAATAFTDLEEDFFRAGADKTARGPAVNAESFDDLDEGYQPVGFWDRLLGRKPKR